jgi:N-acetylmuramoyl-L-alanine amidase
VTIDLSVLTVMVSLLFNISTGMPEDSDMDQLYCVALNAYHEARGEDFNELLAVSQVVMNRVDDPHYPDDACAVVTEGPTRASWRDPDVDVPIRNRCQFSWYCDGKSDAVYNLQAWGDCVVASYLVYYGLVNNAVGEATHYFAHNKVVPAWSNDMVVTKVFDGHTYLRRK